MLWRQVDQENLSSRFAKVTYQCIPLDSKKDSIHTSVHIDDPCTVARYAVDTEVSDCDGFKDTISVDTGSPSL
jgi:hypothetical protein